MKLLYIQNAGVLVSILVFQSHWDHVLFWRPTFISNANTQCHCSSPIDVSAQLGINGIVYWTIQTLFYYVITTLFCERESRTTSNSKWIYTKGYECFFSYLSLSFVHNFCIYYLVWVQVVWTGGPPCAPAVRSCFLWPPPGTGTACCMLPL